MKRYIAFIFASFLASKVAFADCRGCCSHHKGVTCKNGVTMCRDGSALSLKCQAKECSKCEVALKNVTPSKIPYERKLYGGWIEQDGSCQNTRHKILAVRSKTKPVYKTRQSCRVVAGTWVGPYSHKTFYNPKDVEIDHVIPLKYAHEKAGYAWTEEQRVMFANDPENLLVTSAQLNRKKGAKDPSRWMPPHGKCGYLEKWNKVAKKYAVPLPEEVHKNINKCRDSFI